MTDSPNKTSPYRAVSPNYSNIVFCEVKARPPGATWILHGETSFPAVPPLRDWVMPKYDPNKHQRRSIRLKGWDYRSPGYYFVTICTHQRENLFETAVFQEIATHTIQRIPTQKHAAHVDLDKWIVMPNHAHLILFFRRILQAENAALPTTLLQNAPAGSLGVVVGRFKTAVPPASTSCAKPRWQSLAARLL